MYNNGIIYKITLLYADDKIIISNSGDDVQREEFLWNNILKYFDMNISCRKSKKMACIRQQIYEVKL
jgi:hypothetical protein